MRNICRKFQAVFILKVEIIAITEISHFQKATDQVAPAVVICLNSLILRKGHTVTNVLPGHLSLYANKQISKLHMVNQNANDHERSLTVICNTHA